MIIINVNGRKKKISYNILIVICDVLQKNFFLICLKLSFVQLVCEMSSKRETYKKYKCDFIIFNEIKGSKVPNKELKIS